MGRGKDFFLVRQRQETVQELRPVVGNLRKNGQTFSYKLLLNKI